MLATSSCSRAGQLLQPAARRLAAAPLHPCSGRWPTAASSRRLQRWQAVSDKGSQQQQQQQGGASADADEEARIEALEASLSKAKPKGGYQRQIPIRNMTPRQETASSNMAEWKENKLFPEGWEEMPLEQKVVELYMGNRGALFWANRLAWWGAGALGGAWVLFRIVLPALGVYKLQGDLTLPPV